MSKTTFSGPIRTGKEQGNSTDTIGTVVATQYATVRATTQVAFLPDNSQIVDVFGIVTVPSSTGAAGTAVQCGIAGEAARFGTVTVSGQGRFALQPSSAATWNAVTGAVVASMPTATAASESIVGVSYIQR